MFMKHLWHPFMSSKLWPAGQSRSDGAIVMASLGMSILSLALPLMTLQIYDRVLPTHGVSTLTVLSIGVGVALCLEIALRQARLAASAWMGAVFEYKLSGRMMGHLLAADPTHFDDLPAGQQLQRLESAGRLRDMFNGEVLGTLIESAFVVVYLGLIAYIGGWLVLVPMVVLVLFVVAMMGFGKQLRRGLAGRNVQDKNRYSFLIESLEGVHLIKSLGLEDAFQRRFESMQRRADKASLELALSAGQTLSTSTFFGHLMVASVVAAGAWIAIDGKMSIGALVACILLSGRIMQPVQKGLQIWMRAQSGLLALRDVQDWFAMPTIVTNYREEKPPHGQVEVKGVSFRYPGDKAWALRDINLSLRPGEALLLEGPGGTTLLEVMSGMYPPTEGRLTLDGQDIYAMPDEARARQVGLLTPSGAIYRGTVRDNLTAFGQISLNQALGMAQELGLQKALAQLPGGLDTILDGTPYDELPPGLLRRIALSRTLAWHPHVLLFANPAADLDTPSRQALLKVLRRMQASTVLVMASKDRAFTALANRTAEMRGGRLILDDVPREQDMAQTQQEEGEQND